MTHRPGRELSSFSIPPSVRAKLAGIGIRTSADLEGMNVVEITKEADISPKDALNVLKEVRSEGAADAASRRSTPVPSSALDMYVKAKHTKIITFCGELDAMLGGGVPVGELTEFCGVPGIGKTQMGIQLAVDVQLPKIFGGAQGHAVYIDTEGSFMADRAYDIASAFATHVTKIAEMRNNDSMKEAASRVTAKGILDQIHYFRVHDYTEQLAVIFTLPKFLKEHPQVKIVVVDSIAFHFRHDWEDFALRARILTSISNRLTQIAAEFETAVVLMNQVTTKFQKGASYLAPALGESWAHNCNIRIMLTWEHENRGEDGQRVAVLYKSSHLPGGRKPYQIVQSGIRGIGPPKRKAQELQN